jgi:Zn-dependent protease with chaperone function/uncharacterized tellurite resistance protein B-like protein
VANTFRTTPAIRTLIELRGDSVVDRASSLIKVLLIALVIPAIGLGISNWIISDLNAEAEADVIALCQLGLPELAAACAELNNIVLLRSASLYAAAIGISIPLLYWLAAMYAGSNRERIAKIFPSVLRLSLILIAITVVLQGAILTYGLYIGESYAIGRVHIVAIGAIGLGAVFAGFQLIVATFEMGKKLSMTVFGRVLNDQDAPKLFGFVRELSEKLGSIAPKNIIVGLDPTFYVTNSNISVPGSEKSVTGETLYLSAPLSRIMTEEELSSVVGHELGHFRGEDTVYSLRFAPVYAGLAQSINALASSGDEGASSLAKLPALAILAFMFDLFNTNVAKISRLREHKADEAGATAGSPFALSTALLKVGLYSGLWANARKQNIDRLNQGKVSTNLSSVFQDSARYDVAHESIEEIKNATLDKEIAHPTDSHPPVIERMKALGVSPDEITKDHLLPAASSAVELVDNFAVLEEELSMQEHQLMVALGVARPPEEQERNPLLNAMYSMAAAMVGADGKIESDEIAVAEGIGRQMFSEFDSTEFREYCNSLTEIANPVELAELLSDALNHEQKSVIIEYLRAIAESDGDVSPEEQKLLDDIGSRFAKNRGN